MTNPPIQTSDQILANALPDAVVVLDQHGNILWWNKAAKNMFKLDKQQKNICHYINTDALALDPVQCTSKTVAFTQDKTRISVSIIPYLDDHYLLLAEDISHVYHLEKMRQDFLANVSHELRTPLTVVHGYLETLLDSELDQSKPYEKIFKQMYQQSLRMESLVNDLLLLSRLEEDNPEKEIVQSIYVPDMLQAIYQEALALSGDRHHRIALNIDENLLLEGVEDEIRSAFSNLVFNAVKYTPAEGEITIEWGLEDDHPCFKVSDTGIGIEAHHIPRLTERFYRVDKARSRSSGGTGLGLAIVKHVLIRHKANLVINSEHNKGSCFACHFTHTTT